MALHGPKFLFNGLSYATKEYNVSPGSFIDRFQKFHHGPLLSLTQKRLALGKSFGRREQLCLQPCRSLNLEVKRSGRLQRAKSEGSEGLSSESIALDEQTLEEELKSAIAEENYAKAAEIRDALRNLQKDIKATVLMANGCFYESFRTGDLAAMQTLWARRDEVCCVHPGVKGISGYDDVIESWNYVWANYEFPLEIKLDDITVHARGDMGYVTCMEFVKTNGGRWGGQFVMNVFEKIDGRWLVCVHHASPVDF